MSHIPLVGRPLPKAPPLFHVYLQPNASLCARGFGILSVVITAIAAGLSALLLGTGLWLGAVFLVFNCGFLILALAMARRDRQRGEELVVEDGHLTIRHFNFRNEPVATQRLPLYGLVLHREMDPDYGLLSLHAGLRQHRVEIARDLSPKERHDVAEALAAALAGNGYAAPTLVRTRPALHAETV
jgi:uncharacterized membrane protein